MAPSLAVIEAIESAHGPDSSDLPSLYETLDTDALDQLLESSTDDDPDGDRSVTFSYHNYTVTALFERLISRV